MKVKSFVLRACLKNMWGPVFEQKPAWLGATKKHFPCGSSTEEQQRQAGFCSKTRRAAALFDRGLRWLALAARCGDAPGLAATWNVASLGRGQNPSPQDPTEFSDRLLGSCEPTPSPIAKMENRNSPKPATPTPGRG